MLLLVDLDGVVYRGSEPVPGIADLLTARDAAGDTIIYVTNNSRWHRDEYHARLTGMGMPVQEGRVVSAGRATALILVEGGQRPVTMVFGGPGLARELRDVGLRTVAPNARGAAAVAGAVVVGVDFSLSYRRLTIAAQAIRAGARFVATNRDPVYPAADGLWAGAGSMVAALATAAGRDPDVVVGKPEPRLFDEAARSVGMDARSAVVIGDGLTTDIAAANRVGARSVLMLTGVTSQADVDAAPVAARPTAIAADAAELGQILARFRDA
ncbi:MAG: HAD-IIA family hydrolase [Candidatus Limnocylindrales bacterium]